MIDLHILLSTLTLIVMIAAGVQALFLAWQDYLLRQSHLPILLKKLPALETMEAGLFFTIKAGFILLTLIVISSLMLFRPMTAPLWHKTLLTGVTWLVFAGLLVGRIYWGWRGRIAIRWTLAGVVSLIAIYCGTGFLLHDAY